MDNSIQSAIEVFKTRVKEKEDELNRLKKAVNDMARDAGLPVIYASIASENTVSLTSLRSDQFYGQGLSTAIRMYLEMRKASSLSAASVNEIYEAVKSGGFKFEAKDEENAKTGVRNTLRKNTAQFHRLPNGEYGLLAWYPNAKPAKNGDDQEEEDDKASSKKQAPPSTSANTGGLNYFTNKEIRSIIDATTGNFQAIAIEKALRANFPSKILYAGQIPAVIFALKKKGVLKMVAERQGQKGAIYCKV